jgi:hypothetical protein
MLARGTARFDVSLARGTARFDVSLARGTARFDVSLARGTARFDPVRGWRLFARTRVYAKEEKNLICRRASTG